jgi:hypothetical protein
MVTFNGAVVRELLVTFDDERRRLVWSAAGGLSSHYDAAAQVFDDRAGGTVFVWTVDVLPDGVAPAIGAQMDHGVEAIRKVFGSTSPSSLCRYSCWRRHRRNRSQYAQAVPGLDREGCCG